MKEKNRNAFNCGIFRYSCGRGWCGTPKLHVALGGKVHIFFKPGALNLRKFTLGKKLVLRVKKKIFIFCFGSSEKVPFG